jgi:predicted nicotinamide N-methyase
MQRCFFIPLSLDDPDEGVEIVLHEPSITEDNLGLKTWASSYLLAKRMVLLRHSLPYIPETSAILELGAGTGLVGMATAAALGRRVVLTDLPEIVPNLQRNSNTNAARLDHYGASTKTAVLDWTSPNELRLNDQSEQVPHHFPLIVVADPIYSSDHPRWLVQAIDYHLSRGVNARVVAEMPLRECYVRERQDFRDLMQDIGLITAEEGEEVGFDDWSSGNGEELSEVRCWWSVWRWR